MGHFSLIRFAKDGPEAAASREHRPMRASG